MTTIHRRSPLACVLTALAGVALAVMLSVTTVGSAGAQSTSTTECYPPGPGCTTSTTASATTTTVDQVLRNSNPRPRPGGPTTVTTPPATFGGGTTITGTIRSGSGTLSLGSFTANADGSFSGSVTIPCGVSGPATIIMSGTDPTGAPISLETQIEVSGAGTGVCADIGGTGGSTSTPSGNLPQTGAAIVIPAALVGLGLVAAGVLVRRRAKKGSPTPAS